MSAAKLLFVLQFIPAFVQVTLAQLPHVSDFLYSLYSKKLVTSYTDYLSLIRSTARTCRPSQSPRPTQSSGATMLRLNRTEAQTDGILSQSQSRNRPWVYGSLVGCHASRRSSNSQNPSSDSHESFSCRIPSLDCITKHWSALCPARSRWLRASTVLYVARTKRNSRMKGLEGSLRSQYRL